MINEEKIKELYNYLFCLQSKDRNSDNLSISSGVENAMINDFFIDCAIWAITQNKGSFKFSIEELKNFHCTENSFSISNKIKSIIGNYSIIDWCQKKDTETYYSDELISVVLKTDEGSLISVSANQGDGSWGGSISFCLDKVSLVEVKERIVFDYVSILDVDWSNKS